MNYPNEWREFFETLPELRGKKAKIETGGPSSRDIIGVIAEAKVITMDEFVIKLEPDAISRDVHPVGRGPMSNWTQAEQLEFRVTSHYFGISAPTIWQDRLLGMPPQSFAGKISILLKDGDTFEGVEADQRGWLLSQQFSVGDAK
ncbi:hypothetical protein HY621_00195 [Candidatus Uhrbacteria bacterium]|nr:hypothetical protein [Candidatus Uhrbacteria bacterium]